MEKALSELIFGKKNLSSPRRDGINIVINATELRTGTAFRFGSRETGSSRYDFVDPRYPIKVSEAVAASASFPILLPAFDRLYKFLRRNKYSEFRRVLLTDGGVYDNLGITPFEPGRSPEYSSNSYSVDYIISCSAGAGIFSGDAIPYWWPTRMIQSFDSTFRRVQEWSMKALHHYISSGKLKGFIFSYLGQIDGRLPCPPMDLIPREAIKDYPTNFSAMDDKDIENISKRGEQLTRLLITRYCPEL